MNLATMTTQAPAVRKHGGGRARRYLLTLLLIGRPTRLTGGEINRRGEAATYPNHFPTSCAAAAYPTTGVRRARKSSTPLRSTTRPHAQLVEGYSAGSEFFKPGAGGTQFIKVSTEAVVRLLELRRQAPVWLHFNSRVQIIDQDGKVVSEASGDSLTRRTKVVIKVAHSSLEHSTEKGSVASTHPLPFGYLQRMSRTEQSGQFLRMLPSFCSDLVLHYQPSNCGLGLPDDCMQTHRVRKVSLLPILNSRLTCFSLAIPRHPSGHSDTDHRTKRLHPRRSSRAVPRKKEQPDHKKSSQRRDQQQSGIESDREFFRHAQLPDVRSQLSLPAPLHHVQQVAA